MKKFIFLFSVVLFFVGSTISFINANNENTINLKSEVNTFLSDLSTGITLKDNNLLIDKSVLNKESYVIGNTGTVVIFDNNKSFQADGFDKNYLFSKRSSFSLDTVDDSIVYIIVFGSDGIHYNSKSGYGEILYSNLELNSNVLSGYDLLNVLNINEYLFLNIPSLIADLCFSFLIYFMFNLVTLFIFCYFYFNNSNKRNI